MGPHIYTSATAVLSLEAVSMISKKDELSNLLLAEIGNLVQVKDISIERTTIEVSGQWLNLQKVYEILLKAYTKTVISCASHETSLQLCSAVPNKTFLDRNEIIHHHSSISANHIHSNAASQKTAVVNLKELGSNQQINHNISTQVLAYSPDQGKKEKIKSIPFEDISDAESESPLTFQRSDFKTENRQILLDHSKRPHCAEKFQKDKSDASCDSQNDFIECSESDQQMEKGVTQLKCKKCEFTTKKRKLLNDHVSRQHSSKCHSCMMCKKIFGLKRDLVRHSKIHDKKKFHKCVICQKRYSTIWFLKEHLKSHEPNFVKRIFRCGFCKSGFASKQNLERHLSAVHGKGDRITFCCKDCGSSFFQKRSLLKHQTTHKLPSKSMDTLSNDQSNYPSRKKKMDEGQTKSQSSLVNGTNLNAVNTDESKNKFQCNICNRYFTQSHSLKRHRLIHSNLRPFNCDICSKAFRDKSVRRRHKLAFHKKL